MERGGRVWRSRLRLRRGRRENDHNLEAYFKADEGRDFLEPTPRREMNR